MISKIIIFLSITGIRTTGYHNSTVFFNTLKQLGPNMGLQRLGEAKFWPQDGSSKESYYEALNSNTVEVTWRDF